MSLRTGSINFDRGRIRSSAHHFELFSNHVANVCFGRRQPTDRSVVMVASGGTADVSHAKQGRRSSDYSTCLRYGTVSAVHGQASGPAAMLSDSATSSEQHIISMNEFDDAGMWVQDPASRLREPLALGPKVQS